MKRPEEMFDTMRRQAMTFAFECVAEKHKTQLSADLLNFLVWRNTSLYELNSFLTDTRRETA